MAEPVLIAPVLVDALVVDATVRARDNFRLWPFDYLALRRFMSPEPDAFDRNVGGGEAGIYLQWTLPDALRHGTQASPGATPSYPPVPNRWLIARFLGQQPRTVTAWVVEGDCPFTEHARDNGYDDTQCSLYLVEPAIIDAWRASSDPYRNTVDLDPASTDPQVANIGIAFRADGWRERSPRPSFLTAVAPGNSAFSVYTAHNRGVFSFYDALDGVQSDTVSYAVVGWYADPAQDVLAHSTVDLLEALNWSVAGTSTDPLPRRSCHHGLVLSIGWHRDGIYPPGAAPQDPLHDIRASGRLGVGIGNTTEDAFLALARRELTAKGYDTSTLPLLRAFLYGVLPLLNETGGDVLAQRRMADLWFGSVQGGYGWTVTPPPGPTADGSPPFQPPAWLTQLNADQARLDAELATLYSLQWQFNALWIKGGLLPNVSFPEPPAGAPDEEQIAAALDPTDPHSLGGRLVAHTGTVLGLVGLVPQPIAAGGGTPQDAFERGVAAFVAAKGGLPDGAVLKAVPASPYSRAGNPVVVLSGVTPPALSQRGEALLVRRDADVVTGLTVSGTTIGAQGMPTVPSLSTMPAVVASLLAEYYLLDPASAAALAAAGGLPADAVRAAITAHAPGSYTGILPALDLTAWQRQPWEPLYFEWSVQYLPVSLGADNPGPWQFDGQDYHLAAGPSAPPPRAIGAISLLSQHASVVFGDQLARFVKQHPDETALAQLDTWLDTVNGWQVLSQELVGFHDLIALRDHRAFRRPTAADQIGGFDVADLAGYVDAGTATSLPARYRGQVTSWPYLPSGPTLPFSGVRAGQMYFNQVMLYDKFGRVLHVVDPDPDAGLFQAANFPVDIDPALAVDHSLAPTIASVIQLPPRLVQGGRLGLTLLDGHTGVPVVDGDPAANPVGGWLLPNHLDASLLLHAADGTSLGSYRLYETATGSRAGAWAPPAHGTVSTVADVARLAPLVASFIAAPELAVEANFSALLAAIDTTLWTVDPLGARADQSLSVLIGRPLALVPLRMELTLDGAAFADAGWPATLDPPVPDFVGVSFPVRLGDQATRDDGLVGYFANGSFATFNSVVAPGAGQTYLRQIGPPGPGVGNYVAMRPAAPGGVGDPADVVLLLDPRAAVHATSGVVPTVSVRVPDRFVGPALGRLELQFQMPAAVTFRRPTPAPAGQPPAFPEAVTYPVPAGQHGEWTWWQPDGTGGWSGAALLDATTDAQLTGAPGIVADGVLQLIIDLDPDA